VEDLREFCHFAAAPDQVFGNADDPEVRALVSALDELTFGAPKEGFIPAYSSGMHKGLPGCDLSIDYPGPLHYPAVALIYAAKQGLPLVNDNPLLPVPGLGGQEAKYNEKILSTIMAMECLVLALPAVPPLSPREIVELRHALTDNLQAFRRGILRLATNLNGQITKSATHSDLLKAAHFIAATEVQPALLELQEALSRSKKPWTVRAFEAAKQVPELVSSFATMPLNIAVAKALAVVGGIFVDDAIDKREAARSPMYYLLRARQLTAKFQKQ